MDSSISRPESWQAPPDPGDLPQAERDAHFQRLERRWQDEVGRHLLDRVYDAPGTASVFESQFQRVIDLIDLARPGFIAEVGCGKGQFLAQLRSQTLAGGLTAVGVDLSQAVASLPGKGLKGVQADGRWLPFADESLSVLVYHGALHHVIDYEEAIRESYRALVPGGFLYIFEPVATPFTSLVHRILDPIIFRKMLVYESPVDLEYKDHFTKDRMLGVLRELEMPHSVSWSDWLAYPLTGCYGGSPVGRSRLAMRLLLAVENVCARIPGVRRLLDLFAWRILIVARKPESPCIEQ